MEPLEFETRLRQRLKDRWNCDHPKGLSNSEIEESLGMPIAELPAIYVAFLHVCGADGGDLFYMYHWSAESRGERNQRLNPVAEEYEFELPPHLYTFVDYIGDYFWCFQLGNGDDPPVIRYDLDAIVPVTSELSEFFLTWEQCEAPVRPFQGPILPSPVKKFFS